VADPTALPDFDDRLGQFKSATFTQLRPAQSQVLATYAALHLTTPGERREKEAELARWSARQEATAMALGDLVTRERRRLDSAQARVAGQLSHLNEQRERRDAWFASHPDSALRLGGIERDLETLNVVGDGATPVMDHGRGPAGNPPWLLDTPANDRGLDLSLGR
jgi:hypothetical protein